MNHFVSVIIPSKKVKKSLVNHMISSAGLPFNESTEYNYTLFEDKHGKSVLRLEIPNELTAQQSDKFAKKLAETMFNIGYEDFDIEVSTSDVSNLTEAQQVPELDAIVSKYAKQGMTLADVAKMEAEAKAAKPQDAKQDASFLQKALAGLNKLASSDSWRVGYALAHAAERLGLPGLYGSDGNFHFLDAQGEAAAAAGANLDQVEKLSQVGLVSPEKIAKIEKNFAWDAKNKKLQGQIQRIKANQAKAAGAATTDDQSAAAAQGSEDNMDNAANTGTQQAPAADNPFAKMNKVEANQAAYDRLVQLRDLLKKVGTAESISYRDSSLLESLFEDAADDEQIKKIVGELKQLRDLVSPANQAYIDKYLTKAEPVIAKMQTAPTAAKPAGAAAKPGGRDFTALDDAGDEPRFQVELLGKGRVLKSHKGDKLNKDLPFVDVDRQKGNNKFRVRVYAPAPRLDAFLKKQGLTPVNSGNGYNGTGTPQTNIDAQAAGAAQTGAAQAVSSRGITVLPEKEQTLPNAIVIKYQDKTLYVPTTDGSAPVKVYSDEKLTQTVGGAISSSNKVVFDEIVRLSKLKTPAAAPAGDEKPAGTGTAANQDAGQPTGTAGSQDAGKPTGTSGEPQKDEPKADEPKADEPKADSVDDADSKDNASVPAPDPKPLPKDQDQSPEDGAEPAGSQGAEDDVAAGVKGGGVAPMTKDEYDELQKLLQKQAEENKGKTESRSVIARTVLKELSDAEKKRLNDLMNKYKAQKAEDVPAELKDIHNKIGELSKPVKVDAGQVVDREKIGQGAFPDKKKDDKKGDDIASDAIDDDHWVDVAKQAFEAIDGLGTNTKALSAVMRSLRSKSEWEKLSRAYEDLDDNDNHEDLLTAMLGDLTTMGQPDHTDQEKIIYSNFRRLKIPHFIKGMAYVNRRSGTGNLEFRKPYRDVQDEYKVDKRGTGTWPK